MKHAIRLAFITAIVPVSLIAEPIDAADMAQAQRLVDQASQDAPAPPISEPAPGARSEFAKRLLSKVNRTDLCKHIDTSRERFQAVLGESATSMPAVEIAIEAMERTNVKQYCAEL